MIVWLNEICGKDILTAGGKAANLGEMVRAGFPVPLGFCVTTDAYKQHFKLSSLWLGIQKLLNSIPPEDVVLLEEVAGKIRRTVEETPMPEQVKIEIQKAYAKLIKQGYTLVAVRSSATAEDLPEASFAGQQETYLSVFGEEDVLKYVKKCWASLWTARSIAYRNRNGFYHENVALAVVVQGMVEAEKSGVLFTINPLSGEKNEMLVNASYGLGESIVSGRVTPDNYRISKKTGKLVLEQQMGSKEIQIRTAKEGLTLEEGVTESKRNRFCLEQHELKQLSELGMKVEEHYKAPQDIEWAFAGGKLYLLQTRPVTAMAERSQLSEIEIRKLSKTEEKILNNFKEHVPDPPHPLEYAPLIDMNEAKNSVFHELGLSMPSPEKMIRMDEKGIPFMEKLSPRPNIRLLLLLFNIRRLLYLGPSGVSLQNEERLNTVLKELKGTQISSLNTVQLVEYIEKTLLMAKEYGEIRFRVYVFPMVLRGIWLKILTRMAKVFKEVSQYDFLAALDYKTALIEEALYELAEYTDSLHKIKEKIIEMPSEKVLTELEGMQEGIKFLEKMKAFLEENGARTMKAYLPFSSMSWGENPVLLLNILAAVLRSEEIGEYKIKRERGEKKFLSMRDTIVSSLPAFLKSNFLETLENFRNDYKGREALLYKIEECYALARRGVKEAALRIELESAEDVKYLKLEELYSVLKEEMRLEQVLKNIQERKLYRCHAEKLWKGESWEKGNDHGKILKGLPGSPGTIKGIVRVIDGPAEFAKLQKGDVLVCRFTDPAWTPLFSIASAVVCDTGGPLSHAAIVAREYGMPAVLGTKKATSMLKDGDVVLVNGSKGTVSL